MHFKHLAFSGQNICTIRAVRTDNCKKRGVNKRKGGHCVLNAFVQKLDWNITLYEKYILMYLNMNFHAKIHINVNTFQLFTNESFDAF